MSRSTSNGIPFRVQRALRRATAKASGLWRRMTPAAESPPLHLEDVRPRLEHYLRAMYGRTIRVEAAAGSPPDRNWSRRALGHVRHHSPPTQSESDELCIRLPATLDDTMDGIGALARYRVLAVEHAERLHRATAVHATHATTPLERDLYQLAESVGVHEALAQTQPGLRAALAASRASALRERTMPRELTTIERRVELLVRATLDESGESSELNVAKPVAAADSLAWARRTAAALEDEHGATSRIGYRGLAPVALWGTAIITRLSSAPAMPPAAYRVVDSSEPNASPPRPAQRGMTPSPMSSPSGQMQDPSGTDSQTSADAVPEDGSSDAESALAQQGATSSDAGVAADDGAGAGQPGDGQSSGTANVRTPPGVPFRYPEWDRNANDFHPDGAVVRVRPAALASPEWADAALREHAVLVRQARQQFEQLQSQRVRLTRRNQGDDLDLDACVSAFVDRRAGHTPDDRLYTRVQPGRRALAITLLIDVSQSTREVVHESQRVIDLERLAALVAAAALDALGDDYSVLAFSSDGAADVRVTVVKEFADANSETVRRRISALAPDGKTRLGAAIRHATAGLSATDAPHRLLIILSDGKPNDRDRYFVDYGVADSRRAVVEARSEGVHPYCITVDREGAAEYMADIFGETGYLTVQKPEQLPRALLRAVQRLLD